MTNSMISVRIPRSLVEEFREASRKDHFLDLSEAVRSVIRTNWLKHKDPQAYEISKLRKDIVDNVNKKSQQELIEELKKIRDSILKKDEWNK